MPPITYSHHRRATILRGAGSFFSIAAGRLLCQITRLQQLQPHSVEFDFGQFVR